MPPTTTSVILLNIDSAINLPMVRANPINPAANLFFGNPLSRLPSAPN